jgi:hypothetical protein
MKFAILACAAVAIGGLSACNPVKPYPDLVKSNMKTGCAQGGLAPDVCDCLIRNVEKQVPFEHYAPWDLKAQSGNVDPNDPLTTKMVTITTTCMSNPKS